MPGREAGSAVLTSRIRWGRIMVAAILSEVGVIGVLFAAIAAYTLATPSVSDAQYSSLGEEVGYYVAPAAGALMTFLAALWATRGLTSAFVAHGTLVGIAGVLLTVGFIVGARPDHRVMYVIAFALRLVGGYVGGVVAERRSTAKAAAPETVARSAHESAR